MDNQRSRDNKRLAKNTLLLYFRMLLIMAVSLYTSRVVLNTLGVEDYGIYNVVGGVVVMFSVLSGSLSAAISRFITFELGRKNQERLKIIFSSAVTIQIILALIVCLLAEIGGIWFLNNKMNISPDRLIAANWVLQCSILTFVINLVSVPYNAAIIAHERMKVFAYIGILEAVLKLGAVLLLYISVFDKLKIYAVLLAVVAIIIRLIYGAYCSRNFEECSHKLAFDKKILKEMTSFAGWNFIGSSSAVLRDQGVNIAINLFCGPVVNAARGIAFQVTAAVQSFVSNFMTALNPQITKSYASGEREYMMTLVYQGARVSFYLLLLLSLPILIETDSILILWLKVVPEHTVGFVRLALVFALCESISGPLVTAMLATGNIRNYQLIVGGLQLMNFPISYVLLRLEWIPEMTMVAAIVISQCCLLARLWLLRGLIGLSARSFLKKVYLNILFVSMLSAIIPILVYSRMDMGLSRFFTVGAICLASTLTVIFYIGCSRQERELIAHKISNLKNRLQQR